MNHNIGILGNPKKINLPFNSTKTRIENQNLTDINPESFDAIIAYPAKTNKNSELSIESSIPEDVPCIRISKNRLGSTFFTYSTGCSFFSAPKFDAWFLPHEKRKIPQFIRDYTSLVEHVPIKRNLECHNLLNPPESIDNPEYMLPVIEEVPQSPVFWRAWLFNRLFNTPGVLYTSKQVAYSLGIKEDVFLNMKDIFEPAKYNGIFSDYAPDLWWGIESELIVTRNGIKFSEDEMAVCPRCKKRNIHCSAYYTKDNFEFIVPAHYSCSNIKKSRCSPFDNYRIVSTDEPNQSVSDIIYNRESNPSNNY